MRKYLILSSTLIFVSMITFSVMNGSIFLEDVDKLTANILTIHIEIGLVNYFISKFIYWIATKDR